MKEASNNWEYGCQSGDVIHTSEYVTLEDIDDEPNYEGFAEAVAMAVNSVSRGKYSKDVFCEVIGTLLDRYSIPHYHEPSGPEYYNGRVKSLGIIN